MDNTINNRQAKGKEIADKPDQIKRIDELHYQVKSQSSDTWYDLFSTKSGWVCTCPDSVYRKVCCKHTHCLEFSLTIRKQVERKQVVIEQVNPSICPQCQSDKIVKHGLRHNKYGDLQRFSCKDCSKRFSINLGFEGMRSSPQTITSAMQLYFTGESLRNVQKFLRLQGVEVSHKTVYKWIKKYIGLMEKYLEQITPQVSNTWRADEVFIKVKGNTKYLYALMDDETRYWIAKQVSNTKYTEDVRPLFVTAKQVTGKRPETLITDGARNFAEAFTKEFYTREKPQSRHVRNITFKGQRNNNKMERLNGEFRDREKVVRGLKKSDSVMINGYQLYHNYIRPHMSLDGKTPAQACGIEIEGKDKWKTLIQRASL